jgi:hypothetical protein
LTAVREWRWAGECEGTINCELGIGPREPRNEREGHKAEHLRRKLGWSSSKLDGNIVTMCALENIFAEKGDRGGVLRLSALLIRLVHLSAVRSMMSTNSPNRHGVYIFVQKCYRVSTSKCKHLHCTTDLILECLLTQKGLLLFAEHKERFFFPFWALF